ncbi:MAG: hypothetical protein CHACPFDD_01472 [Phycisphaerae bacterium]|nr:hypothetical protein [Phycisphaerae bacterium]
MTKVATTVRCVPRYGFDYADVRTVVLDLPHGAEEHDIESALGRWFAQRGISDAVYAIEVDDDGYFAVINDEVFGAEWGTPVGL